MRIKVIFVIVASVMVLFLNHSSTAHAAAQPPLPNNVVSTAKLSVPELEIPSLNLTLPIIVAPFYKITWDFSHIIYQAAFLEGRPVPGQGTNTVIAAHSELAYRRPGPFFNLNKIQLG